MFETSQVLKGFVVLEGIDGAGTTTQSRLLHEALEERGRGSTLHAEPTGGPAGKLIRRVLSGELTVPAETMACLFAADRWDHLEGAGGIRDSLRTRPHLVCDRYLFSSFAYQGIDLGWNFVYDLNKHFPLPETVILIDVSEKTAAERLSQRSQKEIYETLEFQKVVRENYRRVLGEFAKVGSPVRCLELDGARPVEELHSAILNFVLPVDN